MKITKKYLRQVIKESIKEGFGDDPLTAYIVVDEGSYNSAKPVLVLNDFEKAKKIAKQIGIDAEDPHESYVVIYKVELTEEKQVYKFS